MFSALLSQGSRERSAALVHQMLHSLGPVQTLPRSAAEFTTLLADVSCMKIPVPALAMQELKAELSPDLLSLLSPEPGRHKAAESFCSLICNPPYPAGKEGLTMLVMQMLFHATLSTLGRYSGFLPVVRLNLTDRGADSVSDIFGDSQRPGMVIVHNSCTLMIGEDKAEGKLQKAQRDIRTYAKGGLAAVQYGSVPGIPAYAASGTSLQFMFMSSSGQVDPAGPLIDLSTYAGRLSALCTVIHCYRLMKAMSQVLPFVDRTPLWCKIEQDDPYSTEVMVTPRGAVKTIGRFKSFAARHGVTQESVKAAYEAAGVAAAAQQQEGQLPFLVRASAGPDFSRNGMEVHTAPLGYHRSISTELDARHLARSCLRAAGVLHAAGVVHTDLRLRNVVWLNDGHCMVIDLELCRSTNCRLPDDYEALEGWDEGTLELRDDGKLFTPASDLYQIGRMLQQLTVQLSPLAHEFVRLLLSKRSAAHHDLPLTADEALQHAWLTGAAPA